MKTYIIIYCSIIMIYFLTIFLLLINFNENKKYNNIYDDMHYYCENNFDVYAYSGGAMDSLHYSIDKYYMFLNIDDIIRVFYREKKEIQYNEYNNFLKTHNCSLVGENDGLK